MRLEMIADYECVTGEGPLWHPDEQVLYWTDIPQGRLFRYDPSTGHHEQCYEGTAAIGGFTIQADGALLLFTARGAVMTWRNGETSTIIEEIPRERDSQFNDVIAGPAGRVYCGTIPTPRQLGYLYRLDCDASLTVVVEDVVGSNGMGFTPDRRQMYYTDSGKRDIYLFDYDEETGDLANQRTFVHTADDGSVPDGMTVDAEGFVWSARWDGSCLVRYAPDGSEDRRIVLPTKKVSCLTFGGPDYTDIYVTTAGGDHKDKNGALAGALFRIQTDIRGVPEFRSRISL